MGSNENGTRSHNHLPAHASAATHPQLTTRFIRYQRIAHSIEEYTIYMYRSYPIYLSYLYIYIS